MMSKGLNVIIFLFSLSLTAQSFQTVDDIKKLCPPRARTMFMPDTEAMDVVADLMDRLGIPNNFILQECADTKNAEAQLVIDGDDVKRYILYDPIFMDKMNANAKTDWAAVSILVHEVGHHMSSHAVTNAGSKPKWELEADHFMGLQLAKMGGSLEQAQSAMKQVSERATNTHPGREERMKAIAIGWNKAATAEQKEVSKAFLEAYLPTEEPETPVKKPEEKVAGVTVKDVNTKSDIKIKVSTPNIKKRKTLNSASVLDDYFNALGGVADVNKIRSLKYKEQTIRTFSSGKSIEWLLEYEQRSPTLIFIVNKTEEEEYKLSNDSLYYRFLGDKKWKEGAPPIGTNDREPEDEFKNKIYSSTGNFVEDWILLSNPEIAELKDVRKIDGVPCYELQLKPEEDIEGDIRNRKGVRIVTESSRYYRVDNGLLYSVISKKTIENYRRGRKGDVEVVLTEQKIEGYGEKDGVLFPHQFAVKKSKTLNGEPLEDKTENIVKKVFDIQINPFENR